MVNRKRKRYAASHQRSWLWGRNAVLETLRAKRWPVAEFYQAVDLDRDLQSELDSLKLGHSMTNSICERARLTQLCGHSEHQGLLARMGEYPCLDQNSLARIAIEKLVQLQQSPSSHLPPPLFVMCDRVQDAHNLGAILRVADGVRADGVILYDSEQVSITPHVARASAGAVNHLDIFRVANLRETASLLRQLGFCVLAASEKATQSFWEPSLTQPLVVVLGSEGYGIDPDLIPCVDLQVAIPMLGRVGSLNVAVAAGVVLYEIRRQQLNRLTPGRP